MIYFYYSIKAGYSFASSYKILNEMNLMKKKKNKIKIRINIPKLKISALGVKLNSSVFFISGAQ